MTYNLTPDARADMREIWLYSSQTWSVAQAERYIDGLQETVETIALMPTIAREYTEFTTPVRVHPSNRHLIIYRVTDDGIDILRILAARTNWQAILSK